MDIAEIVKHEAVGTITNLAKICWVSKQCVSKWKKLPPGRCQFVHDATGIDYETLRPDIQWQKNQYDRIIGWFTPFDEKLFEPSKPAETEPSETEIGLEDLVGERWLDAVDFSNEQVKTWGDEFEVCAVMRFRLNGKVYTVTEDPSDDYRSSMRNITVGDWPMTNTFTPLRVIGRHRTDYPYGGSSDVLELIDVGTGKIVIEVGTENNDDYYPSFVSNFQPEQLTHNIGKNENK